MTDDLIHHDALGLAALIRSREISATELLEITVKRIERINPELRFISVKAYDFARRVADGQPGEGAFAGVPLLMKDILASVDGLPCRSGSAFFKDFLAHRDNVVARRLKAQGFVILGTTTTPEFGLNLDSQNALVGQCRNPWNLSRSPGGSSGGAAAAVAARVTPIAHGSDGGGSIRIPASHCGVVGLKASRGRVSFAPDAVDLWYGGITEGCLSISVRDTAAYADAIWGSSPGEPYEFPPLARSLREEVGIPPGQLRIGVAIDAPGSLATTPDVHEAVMSSAALLESLGHHVETIPLPIDYARFQAVFSRVIAVMTELAICGAEAEFGRQAGPDDFLPSTWGFRRLGRAISGVEHAADVEMMRQIGRDFCNACAVYDIVLTPTLPCPPQSAGDPDPWQADLDSYSARVFELMSFAGPVNVSGLPAISLPLHWNVEGLPIGIQAIGRRGEEPLLIRLAAQLEDARPWAQRVPPIHA